MKAIRFMMTLLLMAGVLSFTGCGDGDGKGDLPELTAQEQSDLEHLREEEKLARDVYLYAYGKYSEATFTNISDSEQNHMDQVLNILSKYDLEDSASETTGVFNNSELQTLYTQLTEKVDLSLLDALVVGATIEDLDIKDIQVFLEHTENSVLIKMYNSLMCGSRNHLRSYYSQIVENSGSYTPAYITQSEFDSIVGSDREKCGN